MVMAKGMVVVEYLPNMYKTLCLIPVMQKKQNNKNNNRKNKSGKQEIDGRVFLCLNFSWEHIHEKTKLLSTFKTMSEQI